MQNNIIKKLIPTFVLELRRKWYARRAELRYSKMSPKELFTAVYENSLWGKSDDPFFSGTGSHDQAVVDTYLQALRRHFSSTIGKFNVVDLGCGDFNTGSQTRDLFNKYIACDVVPSLIERNKSKYQSLNVDFRCIDIVANETFPPGDIVVIRQVLQHLSNQQIMQIIPKLYQYKYAIITEHLPLSNFTPNIDKPAGPSIRIGSTGKHSGIVLTTAPFNFRAKSETILCTVPEGDGEIVTRLYEI
jgi:hypothetical protein